MREEGKRPAPIHLKEGELLGKLPEKIGNVPLILSFIRGKTATATV